MNPNAEASVTSIPESEVDGLPPWKRAIDLAIGLAALPLLAVVTLLVATVIAPVSPGPVLYCQERVGYRGRRFRCFKFRTMKVGAGSDAHRQHCATLIHSNAPMAKLDTSGDSRLIPGARLIRAAGLDELPQILNVLRGDMSVVGPRPCTPYEFEQYLPRHRLRTRAMPGLTGLWQVSGKNRTTFEEMIRLDLEYLAKRSFALDLKILARTTGVIFRQIYDLGERPPALPPARDSEREGV
jgi:lipopolysaccharide/colanic/teichoic acid biosynthesis glycosyltransferase